MSGWVDGDSPISDWEFGCGCYECCECEDCYELDEEEQQDKELEGLMFCLKGGEYVYPDHEACDCFTLRK